MPSVDLFSGVMFVANLVMSTAIFALCVEVANRWKNRKMLSFEFVMTGANNLASFVLFTYWMFYGSGPMLLLAAASGILLSSFLSAAVMRMLYSPKPPLNWILATYVFIPAIYIMTSDLQLMLFHSMTINALVMTVSFAMVCAAGRGRMKLFGAAGAVAGLLAMAYMYFFVAGVNAMMLWTGVDALAVVAFAGFLWTSLKRPRDFIADYNARKDGK